MVRTRFSKVLALVLVFVMVMSSGTSALAYTVISNKLTATVTVTAPDPAAVALTAVNDLNITKVETDTEFKMQAALENTALGLDLTEYNKLTAGGRRQAVADFVSFTKFAKGNFANVDAVQAAFDTGVTIEMNKMNFVQLLNGGTSRTLQDIVTAMKADNSGLLTGFSTADVDSFFDIYGGAAAIENQTAVYNAYLALDAAGRSEVETMFKANTYSGSFVTTFGYLKTAIDSIPTGLAVTLEWLSGGTKDGDNLAIENVVAGGSKTISFEATANKAVSNLGYVVTSDMYISINGIEGLKHFIDSGSLTSGATETKSIAVQFNYAGDYNLTVEAIQQDDTTPTTFTATYATVTSGPRIELGFKLSESIDLSQDKLGNIIISYGKMNVSNFEETLKSDGTPIVKSKTWSGYLNLGATTTKYCSGAENDSSYINLVPADEVITTVVDPNYTTMGYANDSEWIAAVLAGNVAVRIIVIDNEGNFSEQLITANQ